MIDWVLEGVSFGNCNCDYSCPCQFELRPTHGGCRGFGAMRIDRGHFGNVRLDGLSIATIYAWPGAVFEGDGAMQAIIDERADDGQRQALVAILHGGETEEAKTHWWVFHAMSSTIHDPVFAPIDIEVDVARRRASVVVPGLIEAAGRPIISPATGQEHRVRIDFPKGIEFAIAEIGSGSTKAGGAIPLDLDDTYGQFYAVRLSGKGVLRADT
jgi:hypothetical protein